MNIFFSKTILKYLSKLEKQVRANIIEDIEGLPDKGDIRKMKRQSIQNIYRLRIGKYRILYIWEKDTVKILDIDTRGNIYK
jgi:mRNA-degrading endonuclease RelE of RelBE toxin-antitoxin system